jgi:tRNA A22 N-methylase
VLAESNTIAGLGSGTISTILSRYQKIEKAAP